MAVDCAKDGVRVNSVSPGSVRTPMLEFSARSLAPDGSDIEDAIAGFGRSHAIGRVGTVEEVAALVSFLVGQESGFCVGSDFSIDGGLWAKLGV
jgi:meso-butanediol dehydrogenase / (S,S)-butanediol dehydrogenase / diacetyl reductase